MSHRRLIWAFVILTLCAILLTVHRKEKKVIDRRLVENMFADIRAKTKWRIDGPMLWGFFFTDTDQQKLQLASAALEKKGYRYVEILHPTEKDNDRKTLTLHVEREETHSVESLDARNRELSLFAEEFHLDSYDGMDVGPIPKPKEANPSQPARPTGG